jgi:predicted  nucleic acid-binding Zn-ribbon protein
MTSNRIETLVALWEAESSRLSVEADRAALDHAIRNTRTARESAHAGIEPCEATLAQYRQQELQLEDKLERYSKTAQRTQEFIDTGAAPDFQLALGQLKQCQEIVDALETEILELFETIEASETAVETTLKQAEAADHAVNCAATERENRLPLVKTALESAHDQIKACRREVEVSDLEWYDRLRAGNRVPLAHLRDGACSACQIQPPSQIVRELRTGKKLHRCRQCARFLWLGDA